MLNEFNKYEINKRFYRVCLNGDMKFIGLSIIFLILSLVKVDVFGGICGVCIV